MLLRKTFYSTNIDNPGRTCTVVNDRIRRFTCDRIMTVNRHVVYEEIRRFTDINTVVYCHCIRLLYMVSVSPRVSLYMVVNDRIQLRRYTIVIRSHVIGRNPVVNDRIFPVYGRIWSFTESVTFDLGKFVVLIYHIEIHQQSIKNKTED